LRTHIFPYSSRPGTRAFLLKERVSPAVIKKRIEELKQVCDELSLAYQKKFCGKKLEVLIEGRCRSHPGFLEGYSGNYIKVITKKKQGLVNKIINLKQGTLLLNT